MSLQLSVRYPSPSLLFSNGFENTYSAHRPASSLQPQQAAMLREPSPLPNCVHLEKKTDFMILTRERISQGPRRT